LALTLRGIHRLGLWLLLIILTLTVLIFPTHLTLEYSGIQSIRIFENLSFFAIVFCAWLALLLLLLFSKGHKEENDWEKMMLVCIFSAVFLGFWTILTYDVGRGEGLFNIAHVRYLNEIGRIPLGDVLLSYFDFPGLHLIGTFVSQVTGLDPIRNAAMILFFQAVFLAALLYILFRRLLNSPYAAPLAVLLIIQGNIWISKLNIFHPRNLGLVLLVTFLVIISRHKERPFRTTPDTILMVLVATTTAMTHFVTSFLLFFIMLGIYLVGKLGRSSSENASPLFILLFIPLLWAIYWAMITFGGTIQYISIALQDLIAKGDPLWTIFLMLRANMGGKMPLWSDITRLYWWVLIYGLGSILGLWNLFRLNKLSPLEKTATGILLGIIVVSIISVLGSLGGERFDTYILYGGFAAVPILLWFILKLRGHIRRYGFICIIVIYVILSFPTFLTHNNTIEQSAFYPDENAMGKFIEQNYNSPGVYLLEPETRFMVMTYFYQNIHFYGVRVISQMEDETGLWDDVDQSIKSFGDWPGGPESEIIWLFTKRSTLYYQHFFGVIPQNSGWQVLKDKLSNNNTIYTNGKNLIFLR
jgi:hypothetical protein